MQREGISEWLSSVHHSYSSALPGADLGRGSETGGVFSDGLSFLWEHILILGSPNTSEKPLSSPNSSLSRVLPAVWIGGATGLVLSCGSGRRGCGVLPVGCSKDLPRASLQLPFVFCPSKFQSRSSIDQGANRPSQGHRILERAEKLVFSRLASELRSVELSTCPTMCQRVPSPGGTPVTLKEVCTCSVVSTSRKEGYFHGLE